MGLLVGLIPSIPHLHSYKENKLILFYCSSSVLNTTVAQTKQDWEAELDSFTEKQDELDSFIRETISPSVKEFWFPPSPYFILPAICSKNSRDPLT